MFVAVVDSDYFENLHSSASAFSAGVDIEPSAGEVRSSIYIAVIAGKWMSSC